MNEKPRHRVQRGGACSCWSRSDQVPVLLPVPLASPLVVHIHAVGHPMLVRRVVVHDQVQPQIRRRSSVHHVQEPTDSRDRVSFETSSVRIVCDLSQLARQTLRTIDGLTSRCIADPLVFPRVAFAGWSWCLPLRYVQFVPHTRTTTQPACPNVKSVVPHV